MKVDAAKSLTRTLDDVMKNPNSRALFLEGFAGPWTKPFVEAVDEFYEITDEVKQLLKLGDIRMKFGGFWAEELLLSVEKARGEERPAIESYRAARRTMESLAAKMKGPPYYTFSGVTGGIYKTCFIEGCKQLASEFTAIPGFGDVCQPHATLINPHWELMVERRASQG